MYPAYLLFLSIIPGLIWLFYFLFKDEHPEPKRMILKIFFFGIISAFPAVLLEWGVQKLIPENFFYAGTLQYYLFGFIAVVLGVALVEELSKYFAVRIGALRSTELDEPIDVILYMIIAGLGFATIENIFLFFQHDTLLYSFQETFFLSVFRFFSATFLHALCSGTIGFFIALSYLEIKRKRVLLAAGFSAAILLHGLYNFSIMKLGGFFKFGIPSLVIISLAIFIYIGIEYLKKLESVCKIK